MCDEDAQLKYSTFHHILPLYIPLYTSIIHGKQPTGLNIAPHLCSRLQPCINASFYGNIVIGAISCTVLMMLDVLLLGPSHKHLLLQVPGGCCLFTTVFAILALLSLTPTLGNMSPRL